MPPFLKILALVGTFAMLWVGGGILVHGLAEFGWHGPEHVLHAVSEAVTGSMPGVAGASLAWLATASLSAVIGIVAGAITALFVTPILKRINGKHAAPSAH
jgi:predicted DNA repair protein MutK